MRAITDATLFVERSRGVSRRAAADPEELERLFDTVVGTVTLRVSDLGRVRGLLRARASASTARDDGSGVVELADAEGRVLLRLDASVAGGSRLAGGPHTGLFHNAFRYPDRATLGAAVARTVELAPLFEGASDHGVSDAVYFRDPEGNGIELYRDRPFEEWPAAERGTGRHVHAAPRPGRAPGRGGSRGAARPLRHRPHPPADRRCGARRAAFWRDVVGLDERQRFGPQAVFLAEGLYHHHIGANTWHSAGAAPGSARRPGPRLVRAAAALSRTASTRPRPASRRPAWRSTAEDGERRVPRPGLEPGRPRAR